jgi:hypothetical protein
MGHATNFNQLYISQVLMGISEAFYISAGLSLIADYHQGKTRSIKNWLPTLFSDTLGIPMEKAGPLSTITIAAASLVGVLAGGFYRINGCTGISKGAFTRELSVYF